MRVPQHEGPVVLDLIVGGEDVPPLCCSWPETVGEDFQLCSALIPGNRCVYVILLVQFGQKGGFKSVYAVAIEKCWHGVVL